MPALTAAVMALGVASSVGGTAVGFMGQQKATQANENIAALQQQQMELDAARQRRDIARKAIVARGQALSNATNQGAGFGNSSGLMGGMSQISNQMGSGLLAANQNQMIGNSLFSQQYSAFQGGSMAAMGQGISSFGSMMMMNSPMLGKVGSYFTNQQGWGGSITGGSYSNANRSY